ncbi:MAG: alpha/beta hydrolase [Pseudomonadota bacterium]|nr:alpha/beta hydrolase [Pseudomonadota bacterium]
MSVALRERIGLRVLNCLARSAPCRLSQHAYGAAARQRLDWYRRRDAAPQPTVLFFYGGNWRSGRRQDYRFVADTLMSLGCDVVIPDYRLYPEVRFGEILGDAIWATEAVLEALPVDTPLVLMGHSAGAQLAALLTLDASRLSAPERVRGLVGLAGPYDFFPFTEADHWDLFAPKDAYPASQAVNFVRPDAAPLYLLHGAEDQRVRRGHSKSLMEKQRAVGGTAEREVYPGMSHARIIVEFARPFRARSAVVRDVHRFIATIAASSGP